MGNIQFKSATPNPNLGQVSDITPDELLEALKKNPNSLQVVDVRNPDEYIGELGHIKEAKLIALPTLPEKLGQLDTNQTCVFICRSGGRSAQATAFALSNGFKHVYNMAGGMISWNQLGHPVQKG